MIGTSVPHFDSCCGSSNCYQRDKSWSANIDMTKIPTWHAYHTDCHAIGGAAGQFAVIRHFDCREGTEYKQVGLLSAMSATGAACLALIYIYRASTSSPVSLEIACD